MAWVICFKGL